MEHWRLIDGYNGLYEVSDSGRVRLARDTHAWPKHRLRKVLVNPHGYVYVSLCLPSGRYRRHEVHTLVLRAFRGQRPRGLVSNHRNHIKTDNRLSNLEYTTYSRNATEAIVRGIVGGACGEDARGAKLTEDMVARLREPTNNLRDGDWARQLGVSTPTITNARTGVTWRCVGVPGVRRAKGRFDRSLPHHPLPGTSTNGTAK